MADVPGGSSGLLVKTYKGKDADTAVYRFDAALVEQINATCKQVAIETGQWTEKRSINMNGDLGDHQSQRRQPANGGRRVRRASRSSRRRPCKMTTLTVKSHSTNATAASSCCFVAKPRGPGLTWVAAGSTR